MTLDIITEKTIWIPLDCPSYRTRPQKLWNKLCIGIFPRTGKRKSFRTIDEIRGYGNFSSRPNSANKKRFSKNQKSLETISMETREVSQSPYPFRTVPINRKLIKLECGHSVYEETYKGQCFICKLIEEGKWSDFQLPWEFLKNARGNSNDK